MDDIKLSGEDHLSRFFEEIEPWVTAYGASTFGYLALRQGDQLVVLSGQLLLDAAKSVELGEFRSRSIAAGRIALSTWGLDPKRFLEQLTSGGLPTSDGRLVLPADGEAYSSYFPPPELAKEADVEDRVVKVLLIGSRQVLMPPANSLGWELRAATPPFESEQELAAHYEAGTLRGDACALTVVASPVIHVDDASKVQDGVASIRLRMPAGLPQHTLTLGYRILSYGKAERRGVLGWTQLRWTRVENELVAEVDLPIGPRVSIECLARFADVCHHRRTVYDKTFTPNAVREVYGLFDPELKHLGSFLRQDGKPDQDDFEAGVAFLLSMHGFQVVLLGGTPKTKEAPDLVALTPTGDVLVVECTTGLLKQQDKMAKLAERSERVRRHFDSFDRPPKRILGLEVTSLALKGVEAEREAALKQGIAVFTREDLLGLLEQTAKHPDPSRIFEQLWSETHPPLQSWPLVG